MAASPGQASPDHGLPPSRPCRYPPHFFRGLHPLRPSPCAPARATQTSCSATPSCLKPHSKAWRDTAHPTLGKCDISRLSPALSLKQKQSLCSTSWICAYFDIKKKTHVQFHASPSLPPSLPVGPSIKSETALYFTVLNTVVINSCLPGNLAAFLPTGLSAPRGVYYVFLTPYILRAH